MTRAQITFVAFLLLAFTVLGRWTFAESKARDARIRAVTADKAAAVYLHLYEARGDSIALLASDLAIADSVYRAERDSWQLDRARYVEQAVNEQADHAALADRIRAQVSDVVAVQVDSMEAAGVAAVGAERSARVNAEAEVVRVVELYEPHLVTNVNQNARRAQARMHHGSLVEIVERVDQLRKNAGRTRGEPRPFASQVLEQGRRCLDGLHGEVGRVLQVEPLEDPDDVRMVQLRQNLVLSVKTARC